MAPERRGNTFLGITNGEWIGIAVLVIGAAVSYGAFSADIKDARSTAKDNETAIAKMRDHNEQQINGLRVELLEQIRASENRTREDIRELRKVIIDNRNP